MPSHKKLILHDTNYIIFTYDILHITIHKVIDSNVLDLISSHDNFIQILDDMKQEYNINEHAIELIIKWFYKQYNKTNKTKEYVTRDGRVIKSMN